MILTIPNFAHSGSVGKGACSAETRSRYIRSNELILFGRQILLNDRLQNKGPLNFEPKEIEREEQHVLTTCRRNSVRQTSGRYIDE
jgi:hypothetical protein